LSAPVGFAAVTLLSFKTAVADGVAVIALTGELDVAGSAMLEQELERVAADVAPSALVLDLSDLDFMDSTGLRLVVTADQRSREEGRTFALVRGKEDVQRVFEITRMTDRLRFLETADEAPALGGRRT
jgi:anti-sigma B factor antagonist